MNAPVDEVDPFRNNHQQPEIDGEVVAKENDGYGEHEDDRDQEGAQCEKPDFIPTHGYVDEPMSGGRILPDHQQHQPCCCLFAGIEQGNGL